MGPCGCVPAVGEMRRHVALTGQPSERGDTTAPTGCSVGTQGAPGSCCCLRIICGEDEARAALGEGVREELSSLQQAQRQASYSTHMLVFASNIYAK